MKISKNWMKIFIPAILSVFLAACASSQEEFGDVGGETDSGSSDGSIIAENMEEAEVTESDVITLDDVYTEVTPIAEDVLTPEQMLAEADTPLASRVIYFNFDSAKVADESVPVLEAHGNFISSNGNVVVRLEGHTDERGSREYNIALGDRRAQSVRRILLFQGASVDQVDTVSYGEETPAMSGHSEEAWSKNRRVELVYQVN
jgi:peptidoglycan-associated lipoprotein